MRGVQSEAIRDASSHQRARDLSPRGLFCFVVVRGGACIQSSGSRPLACASCLGDPGIAVTQKQACATRHYATTASQKASVKRNWPSRPCPGTNLRERGLELCHLLWCKLCGASRGSHCVGSDVWEANGRREGNATFFFCGDSPPPQKRSTEIVSMMRCPTFSLFCLCLS
jgi:hypothetical protein